MSNISEFLEKDKGEGYYQDMVEELKILNEKLNAFYIVNQNIKGGFPFSVKDNICVKGFETTASSKMLKGYIPPFNATVIERIDNQKFGFLGKTNMDEFGFGSFGLNNERIGKNPFDDRYVSGGSSSGAAIATSILKYHVAIAESTGGSISSPAAFCGVVGFTPTYGALSRYGLIDYANSLDKIGIIGRSSSDIRTVFDMVKGPDKRDSTSAQNKILSENKKKLIVIDQFIESLDEHIRSEFEALLEKIKNQGYSIVHRSIKNIEASIPSYYIIAMAEASTNLAKYTGFKYGIKNEKFYQNYNEFFSSARSGFGPEAKRRIVLGTFVRSAGAKRRYYDKALRIRGMLIDEMKSILKEGFIISPTMPIPIPKIEEASELSPIENYKMDVLTIPPNLCGFPHLSFPYAYQNGLPMGAQIITDHFNDYSILDFAEEWEKGFEYKFKYNIGSI